MATPQYGMFGPLPDEVLAMQQNAAEQRALNVAQLTPGQRGVYHSSLAGRGMGEGISRVFGKDGGDAMQRSKQMQQIDKDLRASGVNPANFEEYYTKLGEEFAKAGLVKEAANVSQALQAHKDRQASLETKKYDAETARIRAEAFKQSKLSKSTIAQEIFKKNKEYTPASLQDYLDSITDETPNGNLAVLKPFQEPEGYKEVGTTDQGHFVFDNQQARPVVRINGELVPYDPAVHGKATGKGTKVDVDVGIGGSETRIINEAAKPPDAFSDVGAQVAKEQVMAGYKAFLPRYEAAIANEDKIKRMRELVNDGNLITGQFSDLRKEGRRLLGLFNIGDPSKLNDSDLYDKFVIGGVLELMKQLGGSDSNEELRTLKAAAETRQWNPQAIKRALSWIESQNAKVKRINAEFNRGLNDSKRRDNYNFDWTAGQWRTDEPIAVVGDEGKSKAETKTKNVPQDQVQAVANNAAKPPVNTAPSNYKPSSPAANAKMEAAIDKWSVKWGLDREATKKRLLEEKAKRGK